jgi:MFS family permease
LLKASELGMDNNLIPIVYAVINVSHTAIGIPSGILADKIGKEKVLIIGYSIFAVSTVLMAAISSAENSIYAFVLAAIFGLYIGISETVQRAVVPRYVSSELRGTAFGVYNIVLGTSFFVSNVIFGFLWDNYNLNAAVLYSIVLTSAAIIGMLVFINRFSINKMAYR